MALELKESTVPGSVYEHYKGNMYVFLHEVTDHATGAVIVVFKDNCDKLWYRTLHEFFGLVDVEGEKVPEFRFTGQVLPV